MPKRKRVSLSSELHLTMDAISGVRSLTKQWIDSFGMDTRLPDQIRALLAVVTERIRLLDRVVRGTVDPHLVWCDENDGKYAGDPKEDDQVFVAWGERRLARHHRAEWHRARRRLALKKSAPKPSKSKESAE